MTVFVPFQSAASEAFRAFGLIDDVSYGSKPGVLQRYGSQLRQDRDGPLRVGSTILKPYADVTLLAGEVFLDVSDRAPGLYDFEIALNAPGNLSTAIVGFVFSDGTVRSFALGPSATDHATIEAMTSSERYGFSRIPERLRDELLQVPDNYEPIVVDGAISGRHIGLNWDSSMLERLERWFLILDTPSEEELRLEYLGFTSAQDLRSPNLIEGYIDRKVFQGPYEVHVAYETGARLEITPGPDGRFVFSDEDPEAVFRIVLHQQGRDYYPRGGRLVGRSNRLQSIIFDDPNVFINRDVTVLAEGCLEMEAGRSFRPVERLPFSALGHYQQNWCGVPSIPQEFSNTFFRNNIGNHDTDAMQRDDACLHVLQLGHSETGAIQVPLHQKHHILASEIASLGLGRCVVINSFGGNYSLVARPRFEALMEIFEPDMVIFAMHRQMLQLLTPSALQDTFGYRPGQAAYEALHLGADGRTVYTPVNPDAASLERDEPKVMAGDFPRSLVFTVPMDVMPTEGSEVFEVSAAALREYRERYADTTFILDHLHTFAECEKAGYCALMQEDIPMNAEQYHENILQLCQDTGSVCLDAAVPTPQERDLPDLVYQIDAHYTPWGNQWVARALATAIIASASGG